MNSVDKKYVILGSLCALVLMLAVGYAAFNAVLNIKGTTNISSNWDVKITNVTEKNKVGSATTKDKSEGQDKTLCKNNLCNPTWDGLTASFEVDLVAPGDSIEYEITVSNEGDLNAKLDNIVVSDSDNEYITFETSGLAINDTLDKKTSKTLTVKVTYKDVTINNSKPSTSNLTVTLDFSQTNGTGGVIEPDNNVLYSLSENSVSPGDSVSLIEGETYTDYTPLTVGRKSAGEAVPCGSDPICIYPIIHPYFLKHNMNNDAIESNEVCFVKDEQLYCLKPNQHETNKTTLLTAFAESECKIDESSIECRWGAGGYGGFLSNINGNVSAEFYLGGCSVNSSGSASCYLVFER